MPDSVTLPSSYQLPSTNGHSETPYNSVRTEPLLLRVQTDNPRNNTERTVYDPTKDPSESSQFSDLRQDSRNSNSTMSQDSIGSSQSRLPPISTLITTSPERHDRNSPPSYSGRSPISLSQELNSPYPAMIMRNANQPYHSVYAEPSPATSHATVSPHERYHQARSPSQYSQQSQQKGWPGPTVHTPGGDIGTPLSAGTQAGFTPRSTDRSPINEQQQFIGREGPSPPMPMAPAAPGLYQCMHDDCKDRPPFQTQYLLSSHMNVHKPDRPFYCPVPDCPRSDNGKQNSGFKRKNELIRHQLVHSSPGYACPFCPDRDHKYPRPDNLQRHVKVHHMDKNKDDPELRAILSQRIDSDKSSRRRRNTSAG